MYSSRRSLHSRGSHITKEDDAAKILTLEATAKEDYDADANVDNLSINPNDNDNVWICNCGASFESEDLLFQHGEMCDIGCLGRYIMSPTKTLYCSDVFESNTKQKIDSIWSQMIDMKHGEDAPPTGMIERLQSQLTLYHSHLANKKSEVY